MAKIIQFDSYDILNKKTSTRSINADLVVEVSELISYDKQPLTRIKMSTGDFIDVQKSVQDIIEILNK